MQDQPKQSDPTDRIISSDPPAPAPELGDIFADLDKLRLGQSYDGVGVKKVLSLIPFKRPPKQDFVRVNPDPMFSLTTQLLILKEEREESYIVKPALWAELPGDLTPLTLYTAITRAGNLFLWPVKSYDDQKRGGSRNWSQTDRDAVEDAKTRWVKVVANMAAGGYDRFVATGNLPEPVWPDVTFRKILETCFRDRIIESLDHPVLRRLRGEVM